MSEKSVTAVEFGKQLSEGNVQLVDVRTPVEFREVHVEGAVNVPLDRLSVDKVPSCSETEPLYVVCHQGGRGVQACKQLTSLGLVNVVNVEGGTTACVEAGLPVVRGKKMMSLERQVRVAAGSLVLLGVGLGWLVHPAFYALAAFVGAGLVFAGLSDTCGMGMLLARMPWNQAVGDSCSNTKNQSTCST